MAAPRIERAIRADALAATCALALAAALAAVTLTVHPGAVATLAGLFAAGWVLWLALRTLRVCAARWHGIRVEHAALRTAARVLPRYGLRIDATDLAVPGLGDVDLVVTTPAGAAAVEIKSYRRWDATGARAQAAIGQVVREGLAVRARWCVLWLPNARAGWFHRAERAGDVLVVKGGARRLARVLGALR